MIDASAPSPAERLNASRARLRQALSEGAAARGAHAGPGSGASWLNSLKAIPGAGIVSEALQAWWKRHPLHVTGTVVSEGLQAVARPLAQRHPVGLVVGALLVGGLLVSSRPWRWILTPTLLAGLLPQLLTKVVALVPAQSWLAVLDAMAQGRKEPASASRHTPQPPEPPPHHAH